MLRSLFALAFVLLALPAAAQEWSGQGLSVDLSKLGELQQSGKGGADYLEGAWTGEVDGVSFKVEIFLIARAEMGLNEPSDLVELTESSLANYDRSRDLAPFAFDENRPFPGAFGFVSYAWLGVDETLSDGEPVGHFYCLGGILPEHGYSIEISAAPALDEALQNHVLAFLETGVTYAGDVAESKWTDEEVQARWQRQAPDKVLERSDLTVVRSKHYVIMTNVGKGTAKGFGKKIDEAYEEIRKIYPFEDIEGQRLLPIFYFVTDEQYFAWYVKNLGGTLESARRSGGVSYGDVYATYHQATNAPVHIHEATHQVFKNRLRLGGGGSWYQEGVAEYMSSMPSELGVVRNMVKQDKHIKLPEFVQIPSMLYSTNPDDSSGGSQSGNNYSQAAGFIEFMRHGKHKKKFHDFIHAVGRVPRSDAEQIELAFQQVIGRSTQELEEDFVAYWQKRKRPKKK